MTTLAKNQRRRFRLSLLGLVLVPLAVAGLLSWSLGNPEDRLKDVKAAVVNQDEPVQVNGQLVPLGRQLSAKLVGNEIKGNYSWEFATEETARQGLRDGTYVAVVTVPENFSEAATSFSRDPAQAQRARIDVTTSERSRFADEAINRLVTSTAANLLGKQLTTTYLDNIYVGFNTLNDRLGEASDGATSLADGAKQLAGGTGQLSDGADQLSQGARQLSDGLGALSGGADQLSSGVTQLSGGLGQLRDQTAPLPQQAATLADVAAQESQGVQGMSAGLAGMAQRLSEMSAQCPPGILPMCNDLAEQAATARALAGSAGQVTQASQGVAGGLDALAGGMPALAGGIDQLAGGAAQLDTGAGQLRDGIAATHDGASQLADGADQLATGVTGLADGARKFSDGTGQLSSGLNQAVEQLPAYPDGERGKLADAVANPVTTSDANWGFGDTGLSLYAVLALWVGAVATFLVVRAVPPRTLESTRSSWALALRHATVPAAVAIAQALVVTVVVGVSQGLSIGQWFACAGLSLLIAVAFTAVNQALVTLLGGSGRFIAMLVGLVVLANGFVAAVPSMLGQMLGMLPVGPALDALNGLTDSGVSMAGAVVLLLVWAVIGFAATSLALERRRTVRSRDLLAATAVTS